MIKRATCKKSSTSLVELCELATENKVETLFIFPHTHVSSEVLPDSAVWDLRYTYRDGNALQSVTGWKRGSGYKRFTIVLLGSTLWYGSEKYQGPLYGCTWQELKAVCEEIETRLGIALRSSPQMACWELAITSDSRLKTKAWDPTQYPFNNQSSHELQWGRNCTEQERTCIFLHKWDVSGAYLGASQSTHFGYGVPLHVSHGIEQESSTIHAVWLAHVDQGPAWSSYAFPSGTYWLESHYIRALQELGYLVTTEEGYIFPHHGVLLQKWSKILWEARDKTTNPLVRACIKLMYTSLMGTLGSEKLDPKDAMFRPDIRSRIIGTCSFKRAYRINKIRQEHGLEPLMVYTDALYYLSPVQTPYPFFSLTENGRGYRYQGCIDLSASFDYENSAWGRFTGALQELFTEGEGASALGLSYKLEILNHFGWEGADNHALLSK